MATVISFPSDTRISLRWYRPIDRSFSEHVAFGQLLAALVLGTLIAPLVDEQVGGAPWLAAFLLALCLLWLLASRGRAGMLAMLIMPGLFGLHPWNSPVRAYFGTESFPLYFFDLLVLTGGAIAFLGAAFRYDREPNLFFQRHKLLVALVVAILVAKVAQSGVSGETLRNSAQFYYFIATSLILGWIDQTVDVKDLVPRLYLSVTPYLAAVPAVVLLGMALGGSSIVLDTLGRQGLVTPAGLLAWVPPGSLVVLSFLGAGFLLEPKTPMVVRSAIIVLLAYDFVTYWDRALWLAIAAGIAIEWTIRRGWKAVLAGMLALAIIAPAATSLRTAAAQSHNESSEWRLLAWGLSAAAVVQAPLFGHPYNKSLLAQVLPATDNQQAVTGAKFKISDRARSPHNSYLSLLFFGGLVQGGAIVLFILATLFNLGRRLRRQRRAGRPHWMSEAAFRGGCAIAVYTGLNVVLESPIEAIAFWTLFGTTCLWSEFLREEQDALRQGRLLLVPEAAL